MYYRSIQISIAFHQQTTEIERREFRHSYDTRTQQHDKLVAKLSGIDAWNRRKKERKESKKSETKWIISFAINRKQLVGL